MTTAVAPRPTEAQCQATIVEAAQRLGWMVHHVRAARTLSGRWSTPLQGDPGFPDLVLVKGDRLILAELKRRPNQLEPAQQRWLAALAATGVTAMVVWVPEQMDTFINEVLAR